MIKHIIGWIVNFYPNNVFYSKEFGNSLFNFSLPDEKETNDVHETDYTTALLGVVVGSSDHLTKVNDRVSGVFTGVTKSGKDIGDYEIVVKRIK